jgi:glycosyltransferase involved in cell wall biosynthesis
VRVLALASVWPWPPRQGVAIRASKILEALSSRHQVAAVGFGSADAADVPDFIERTVIFEPPPWTALRRLGWMLRARPDLAGRRAGPGILQAVDQLLRGWEPDLLLVFGLELAPLVAEAVAHRKLPVVYDAQNCETSLQFSAMSADARWPRRWHRVIYSLIQWALLRRFERRWLRQVAKVVAVSDEDRRRLSAVSGRQDIAVVPNGVDCEYFKPDGRPDKPREPRLVFTGHMGFRPNVDAVEWFADRILPRLIKTVPDLQFFVVGRSPANCLGRLAKVAPVVITGEVADIRPYLRDARCYVAPLRMGGGTRLKVLEAAAMGVPLVATSLAVEGTNLAPEVHFLQADDEESFVKSIQRILADPVAAEQMALRAREWVQDIYSWSLLAPRYLALIEAVVEGEPGLYCKK